VNRFIWGAVCLNWARTVLRGAAFVRIAVYSPSLWLQGGQAFQEAKAHLFAKPGLAKAQGRLECETLSER